MKINWQQKFETPVERTVLLTRSKNKKISYNLLDILGGDFERAKGSVIANVELANRDFDKLCYRGLTSHNYPFVSNVYGRKRKIRINEVGSNEFEVIRIENERMDFLYMAVRQYGSIPLFSELLLNVNIWKEWKNKFDEMEKFVRQNQMVYLEYEFFNDPDLSPSNTDLILAAIRDGEDWEPYFEGGSSLYDIVSSYISLSVDIAAEKYLDNIYGKEQVKSIKEVKR